MAEYNSVVVLGPTAVGKTAIGVQIALKYNGEIISADSRQTYKGLDIGSGKDLKEYFVSGRQIPFHLIDVATLDKEYTVFHYQQDFYRVFPEILNRSALPVVVGGTGMYLDAIIRNYDLIDVPENKELRSSLEKKNLEELGKMYLSLRPDLHTKADLLERERVVRGIEIALCKGEEARKIRERMIARPDIRPFIIGTTFDREKIRENIYRRLLERIDEGMIEEVENLHNQGVPYERLEKLGLEYRYCALYLQGKCQTRDEMVEKLFISIRQFAKRQETWFRFMEKNGVKINWLPPVQDKQTRIDAALRLVERALSS
ncbi:MAG: tRNA (adenosine(37)-N6)-dimethylallyltransferase MiaA [Treponemataceae bacterium]|nr:tRNA (adenosine(37)-N6)-dimethylallyltransferase MiaA [Treponemataceae bacterium]